MCFFPVVVILIYSHYNIGEISARKQRNKKTPLNEANKSSLTKGKSDIVEC